MGSFPNLSWFMTSLEAPLCPCPGLTQIWVVFPIFHLSIAQRMCFSLDLMSQIGFRFTALPGQFLFHVEARIHPLCWPRIPVSLGNEGPALSLESSPAKPKAGPGCRPQRSEWVSVLGSACSLPASHSLDLSFLQHFWLCLMKGLCSPAKTEPH